MQAERVLRGVEARVVAHLVQRRRAAQVFLLDVRRVVVQRAIRLDRVRRRIAPRKVIPQPARRDQRAHLVEHPGRITTQEAHRILHAGAAAFAHRPFLFSGDDGDGASSCYPPS
ncbi:hypothetical protein D3C87_1825470 [compost metagenome]